MFPAVMLAEECEGFSTEQKVAAEVDLKEGTVLLHFRPTVIVKVAQPLLKNMTVTQVGTQTFQPVISTALKWDILTLRPLWPNN